MPAPKEGDLVVNDVQVGENGVVEAIFSLDGVNIGASALESRLKTIFSVESATTLKADAFSPDDATLSFEPTGDGRIRATVVPPENAGNAYFMRVRMK